MCFFLVVVLPCTDFQGDVEVHLVLVGCRVFIIYGRPSLPVKLRTVVSAAPGARGRMAGRRGGGLQVSLLKRLFQIHLELEGWLGDWVG